MPQYFKGDAQELKYDAAGQPILDIIAGELENFFDGAYETGPLGDLIFDDLRSPLSNAIRKDIFRIAFKEIFDAFVQVGTFEAYITVFKKIFGDDVVVEFTVPAAGKLNIDIEAASIEVSNFISRYIEDNQYIRESVIDQDGDFIVFQTIKGFTSEYELNQMLFEMVPAGIYTEITLTLAP